MLTAQPFGSAEDTKPTIAAKNIMIQTGNRFIVFWFAAS